LDGYSVKLKTAFEYQGSHHYKVGYNCDKDKLRRNQINDIAKQKLCKDNGVTLLIIPTIKSKRRVDQLVSFIRNLCKENKLEIAETSIDFSEALTPHSIKEFNRLNELSIELGGRLISSAYLGNIAKLTFMCKKGHEFVMTPKNVKKGNWCQVCAGVEKKSIEWCIALADRRGGRCLSNSYSNNRTKMLWKCHNSEHPSWSAPANRINQGHWCPACGNALKGTPKNRDNHLKS